MGDRGGFTFQLRDYSYDLPASLIAQSPAERREASRLLIVDRNTGRLEHRQFEDILMFLRPGDVLVVNDTRVVPARLFGTKESGGRVELLVLDPYKDADLGEREGYECLLKSAKRPRPGSVILLEDGFRAEVLAPVKEGRTRTRFISSEPLLDVLGRIGKIPLPPYIQRTDNGHRADDVTAYQTVYAQTPGAVAAPTAGLHFSRPLLERFAGCGVTLATVTLHVGFGTFAPVRTEDIRKHRMHSEYVEISSAAAKTINDAAREGRRIVAVGTTVVRALEWVAIKSGQVTSFSGLCDHFIFPGYRFRIIGSLITNFHLPKSTLLLLVSAFAGREEVLNAYQEAISRRYRFYSYGDAMLIL